MYECPNCGGNLKFDISSQLLKCDYCQTTKDPYEVSKEKDAEESSDFGVTVFTCPQCGGEILSTDTSVAEFCSFCGASTILDSRIRNEKKPARIIPFQKTREACKEAYINRMKHAPFAPDELKQEKYIDSFRGIYMPYWIYNISQKGNVCLKGKKSYRRGDYVYTDYYDLSGDIDARYDGISYDASSSFADNISERIAPYDISQEKPFTPSFLSGFYADTADVAGDIYQKDAKDLADTASLNKIKNDRAYRGIKISTASAKSALCTECAQPERVMYPVWFMSYRKGDRVAYATVNGQTGKVAADIPIDIRKYVTGSFLLAIPLFLFFNLFFTFTAKTALGISIFLAAATFFIYIAEIKKIFHRDRRDDDHGYLHRSTQDNTPSHSAKKSLPLKEIIAFSMLKIHGFQIPGFTGSLIAVVIARAVFALNPVSDIWYYAGAVLAFLGILFTMAAIIMKYNILATRKLPQFNRTGGDDNA